MKKTLGAILPECLPREAFFQSVFLAKPRTHPCDTPCKEGSPASRGRPLNCYRGTLLRLRHGSPGTTSYVCSSFQYTLRPSMFIRFVSSLFIIALTLSPALTAQPIVGGAPAGDRVI